MLSRILRILSLTIIIPVLISCGPVKNYPGPELPRDQTALIRVGDSLPWASAYIDQTQIYPRGNLVLPGLYALSVNVITHQSHDCITRNEFNSYSYDRCLEDRAKDLKKGKSASTCYTSDYTSSITNCRQDKSKYDCLASVQLEAGMDYELQAKFNPGATVDVFKSGKYFKDVPCELKNQWSEREDI